jgi:hypothetical protein
MRAVWPQELHIDEVTMKLREAPHADDMRLIRDWFTRLSRHVQAIDYEGARPIFAEDMIAFGTFTDFMHGRDLAEREQWRNVWGSIRNFRWRDNIEGIVSADRLTAVGMGIFDSDGLPRPRHGDLRPQDGGRALGRDPHPHVAVPRHAGQVARQVRVS